MAPAFRLAARSLSGGCLVAFTVAAHGCVGDAAPPPVRVLLDGETIPKFVDPLPIPAVWAPRVIDDGAGLRHAYTIDVTERVQQVLPAGYPATKVWAYGGAARLPDGTVDERHRSWPGASFEATRGVPVEVTWINGLAGVSHLFTVDPTLHWADPKRMGMPRPPFAAAPGGYPEAQSPVPLVTHLHGGIVPSTDDGHPLAWFTPDGAHGPAYATRAPAAAGAAVFRYPDAQPAATLWYHDHALGITRLNVLAGLAGFYLLRDPADALAASLPGGAYEIPLLIQDRSFHADGSLAFPTEGVNPGVHPYWAPEFFGDVIVVNGKSWPRLEVEPRRYRFRLLDGSNARFYDLRLRTTGDHPMDGPPLVQIGTDGGYLPAPVELAHLLMGPGERADVLVDFSALSPGTTLLLQNAAASPYPGGTPADPEGTAQILRITVKDAPAVVPAPLPDTLAAMPALVPDRPPRHLALFEVQGEGGPLMVTLNGQTWDAPASETPVVGSTEDWIVANATEDAHPIHLHLVQFQLVSRQPFDRDGYAAAFRARNGALPREGAVEPIDPAAYLRSAPVPPAPAELGWKDTIIMYPGEVTRIRVRFAPPDAPACGASAPAAGVNAYPFDPTVGPGYVWHCHILDHEDNEMMRPLLIAPGG